MKKITLAVCACAGACAFGFDWPSSGTAAIGAEVAEVTDADVANVAALDAISIAEGGTMKVTATSALTLKANLSGTGAFTAESNARVTLSGDNSEYFGAMTFNDAYVYVTSRHGLGGTNATRRVTSKIKQTTAKLGVLRFSGAGLTNDVPLVIHGNRDVAANFLAAVADPFVQNGAMYAGDGCTVIYFGDWLFTGGFRQDGSEAWWTCPYNKRNTWIAGNPINTPKATYFVFDSTGTTHLSATNNAATFYLRCGTLTCEAENVLDPERELKSVDRNINYPVLNLNGFDQTTPAYKAYHDDIVTNGLAHYATVTSAKAATLKMGSAKSYKMPAKFTGKAGMSWSGTGTYTLVRQFSDTEGTLAVSAGKVAFDWGAGWGGKVEITGGAVEMSADSAGFGSTRTATLAISGAGKLKVADGMDLSVASFTTNGVAVADGWHAASDFAEWIDGDCSLTVAPLPGAIKTFTWSGAVDGDVLDGANWEGDAAPTLVTGDELLVFKNGNANSATFPARACSVAGVRFETTSNFTLAGAGARLVVHTNGFATTVAAAKGIVTNRVELPVAFVEQAGADWPIAKGTALDFAGDLSGGRLADTVKVAGGGAAAKPVGNCSVLILRGENSGFLPKLSAVSAVVRVHSSTGLGSPSRTVTVSSGSPYLQFVGEGITNAVPITAAGTSTFVTTEAPGFAMTGKLQFYGTQYAYGGGTFSGGFSSTGWSVLYNGVYSFTNKPIDAPENTLTFECGSARESTMELWCPSNKWGGINFYNLVVKCMARDAFTRGKTVTMGRNNGTDFFKNAYFDLNGNDQWVGKMQHSLSGSNAWWPKRGDAGFATVESATPATLHVVSSSTVTNNIRFRGAACLSHEGSGSMGFINHVSDTTGDLVVSNGTVRFEWNAGWHGTNVVVAGGRVYVDALSSTNAFGEAAFRSATHLRLCGGTLEIEDGGLASVTALRTGDGEARLPRGYYGSKTCADPRVPTANKLDCIAGGGVLFVRNRVSPYGTAVIVR